MTFMAHSLGRFLCLLFCLFLTCFEIYSGLCPTTYVYSVQRDQVITTPHERSSGCIFAPFYTLLLVTQNNPGMEALLCI